MLFYTCFPLIISGVSMLMDMSTAQVDNGWILFSLTISFFVRSLEEGISGVCGFFTGALFPLVLLCGLFIFRMLGPGDIKLFCALGSMLGVHLIWKCILVSFFIGACISMAILISNGDFSRRFLYFIEYIRNCVQKGKVEPYYRKGMSASENFHFTVPVFLSVVLYAGGVY